MYSTSLVKPIKFGFAYVGGMLDPGKLALRRAAPQVMQGASIALPSVSKGTCGHIKGPTPPQAWAAYLQR